MTRGATLRACINPAAANIDACVDDYNSTNPGMPYTDEIVSIWKTCLKTAGSSLSTCDIAE
jgi:hypothetical protein